MFCFGFDSSYHAQLSNENLHYINLDSILLTVQMSLPINYLPYCQLDKSSTRSPERICEKCTRLKSVVVWNNFAFFSQSGRETENGRFGNLGVLCIYTLSGNLANISRYVMCFVCNVLLILSLSVGYWQ